MALRLQIQALTVQAKNQTTTGVTFEGCSRSIPSLEQDSGVGDRSPYLVFFWLQGDILAVSRSRIRSPRWCRSMAPC